MWSDTTAYDSIVLLPILLNYFCIFWANSGLELPLEVKDCFILIHFFKLKTGFDIV